MDEQRLAKDAGSGNATEETPLSTAQTTNYTETGETETAGETAPTPAATTNRRSPESEAVDTCCSAMGCLIKSILVIIFIVVAYKYNKLSDSCDPAGISHDKATIASLQSQLNQALTTSDKDTMIRNLKESKSRLNSLKIPSGEYVRFNAASYMDGARVVGRQSFLSSRYSREQTGYVLFERDELPLDKAWCSKEKSPVLTIHLSKNTTPLAVSYQHTKEYDKIPIGAPRTYDVYACYDSECNNAFALVTDCEYRATREKGKEQICNITQDLFDTEVSRIQFRFRENHGNGDRTCAYLIRVYGEKRPSRPELNSRNVELCTDIAHDFYHSSFSYLMRNKSCSMLYSNKCCKDCPECCTNCEIEDFNSSYLSGLIVGIIFIIIPFTIFCLCPCGFFVYLVHRTRKNKKTRSSTESNGTEPVRIEPTQANGVVNSEEPYQGEPVQNGNNESP